MRRCGKDVGDRPRVEVGEHAERAQHTGQTRRISWATLSSSAICPATSSRLATVASCKKSEVDLAIPMKEPPASIALPDASHADE